MPAIQPARLRLQAARLAELFDQPRAFVRALHGYLGLYADRTHRSGQSGRPPPLLALYNVPRPVFRHLTRELHQLAAEDAQRTILLCQALWVENYIEFRLFAAILLGFAPADPADPVINQLSLWLDTEPEDRILAVILEQGVARLVDENPEKLLRLSKNWLADPRNWAQRNGLRLLRTLALDTDANHLPSIYSLITPLLRRVPQAIRPELMSLLAAAASISPQETAFVLRQNLEALDNPDTVWLIRQVLDEFPASQQETLRSSIAEARRKNL